MDFKPVSDAFEILLREIQAALDDLKDEAAGVMRAGDFDRARHLIGCAQRVEGFRKEVEEMRERWPRLFEEQKEPVRRKRKRRGTRVRVGLGGKAFRRPILEALVELGGRAPIQEVLALVERKLADRLTKEDYEPLPSLPDTPRWRHKAQVCRARLVKRGLMRGDSPLGIWEISEAGRQWLAERSGEEPSPGTS